jgi:signal peptidase I
MSATMKKLWKENRTLIFFLILMFVFRSAVADWNEVPTGSMKPTIIEGDRIWVNKMAYDLRIPFTHIPLLKFGDPVRGDIVVFDSVVSDKRLVKRVIGVPGDVVAMLDNVLYINGEPLDYEIVERAPAATYQKENLLGVEHIIRVINAESPMGNFRPVTVPEGHYLALGDNRDESADSRVIGFVPRGEIVGRSRSVVLSFNYDNYYIPRSERFFHRL